VISPVKNSLNGTVMNCLDMNEEEVSSTTIIVAETGVLYKVWTIVNAIVYLTIYIPAVLQTQWFIIDLVDIINHAVSVTDRQIDRWTCTQQKSYNYNDKIWGGGGAAPCLYTLQLFAIQKQMWENKLLNLGWKMS
jgi:hypothetical protein